MQFNNLTGELPSTGENYMVTTKITWMNKKPVFLACLKVQISEDFWISRDTQGSVFNYADTTFSEAVIKAMTELGKSNNLKLIKSSLTKVA